MRDARVEEPPENANVDVIHPGWERTRHTDHSMEIPALSSGLQPCAIQEMLDFDYSCGRSTPSVAAMIYPFGGHYIQKFYWGTKETLLPVYTSAKDAVAKHPDVDVVVNFTSSRSVYNSTLE